MRFSTTFLLACGLISGTAQAQTFKGIGVRVGGNLASGTFNSIEQAVGPDVNYSYRRSALLGYQIGVGATFGSGHWAFQPALVFTEKGLKQNSTAAFIFNSYNYKEDYSFTVRVHYLEMPLNLVYGFGNDGEGLQVFAGPYVAVGVGGRAHYLLEGTTNDPDSPGIHSEGGTAALAFGNTFREPDSNGTPSIEFDAQARRIDAGLNFGVGYRHGPVQVQFGYGLGLLNAQPKYPASYDMPNDTGYLRTAQLTATYYFPVLGK